MTDSIDYCKKAAVLSEALPYIQKYSGKTVVVKYGGAAMANEDLKRAVISDIVLLSLVSIRMVVVHGGGPEIDAQLVKLGKEKKFISGLRYTDDETMDVVQMVLAGKIGKDLAALAVELGGKAVSVSGMDGGIMRAKPLSPEYGGRVGEVVKTDPSLIKYLLEEGYIPIISTTAMGAEKDGGDGSIYDGMYNINADTAAGELAVAMGAGSLILLTDVRGILTDPSDTGTLIKEIKTTEIPRMIENGTITGGMIPKVECCVNALNGKVRQAIILDGRQKHSILTEMLTDGGVGSRITI